MAYLPTTDSSNMTNGRYAAQKIITKAIFFTGHGNDLYQTYDRWMKGLVRSCWNFPYPWPNLGLLPFRIFRLVPVAGTARFSPRGLSARYCASAFVHSAGTGSDDALRLFGDCRCHPLVRPSRYRKTTGVV